MIKPIRLTKEQFIERVKDLYARFYKDLYNNDNFQKITFDEFYKDALKEYEKQNSMTDEELIRYRNNQFNNLVEDVNKLTTKEERNKLQQESLQQLTNEDIKQYEYSKRQNSKGGKEKKES